MDDDEVYDEEIREESIEDELLGDDYQQRFMDFKADQRGYWNN